MLKETMPDNTALTDYNCPVCKNKMLSVQDTAGSTRSGGFTVWCGQSIEVCSAQDVSGHARNVKEAFDIVKDKFLARKDR